MHPNFQRPDVHGKLLAAAMLRRPGRSVSLDEPWGNLTVSPFGLHLTATVKHTPTPMQILGRDTRSGLVMHPQAAWPSGAANTIADALTAIERLVGSGRVWGITTIGSPVKTYFLGYIEAGAEPHEITRISAYAPFEILTPLASMVADARFANVTPAGDPRNWRAECSAHYLPTEPLGCVTSPPEQPLP
jgi:hypothetical protein